MTAYCRDKMDKAVVILLLTLIVIADADRGQLFHFNKLQDGCNAFNYSTEQTNGEISTGQTIFIHKMNHEIEAATRYYHFIIDDNNTAHWVAFSERECNSTSTVFKTISPVKRNDNVITFNDNTYDFEIKISENEGILRVNPIIVIWDFDNICFSKINAGINLFRFEIKAKNIPRLVNGETYYEDNQMDPFIQRVIIPDLPSNYVVEMEFTEKEFNTWDTFCRNITQFINVPIVLRGFGDMHSIDPNALKSLIG